jgi:preprotein translocase subunit YajC
MNPFALFCMGLLPLAAAAPRPPGNEPNPIYQSILFLFVMFFIFYLLLIRPQRRRQRERVEMLESLKKGDHVITTGGIHGVITLVRDRDVKVRVADDCELTFSKTGIARILPPEGEDAKDDKSKDPR